MNHVKKLIIATPFYEQKCWADFTQSLARTMTLCVHAGIEAEFLSLQGDSYVDRARNTLAALFLESDGSHLLFVDSDVGWTLDAFTQLMMSREDVVGAVYPTKNRWNTYTGTVHVEDDGVPICNKDGLILAETLPMGFTRISRSAFSIVAANEPDNCYLDPFDGGPAGPRQGYFTPIQDGKAIFREDAAFCLRCRRAGISIWCEPRATLRHWGVQSWEGNFHKFMLQQPGGSEHVLDEASAAR